MRTTIARLARFMLALGLCAGSAACGGGTQDATVTVIVPWVQNSSEYNAFKAVIGPFEEQNGIQVILEPTQAVTQQLDADLTAHTPPDVVDLPSPAAVNHYEGPDGLQPLDGISLSSYEDPWRSLAESKGIVYAIPVKADVKSLIWYNKDVLQSAPTWTALEDLSRHGTPWCLGLASGPTSGWPGDDWVADILLSRSGNNADKDYEDWLGGQIGWTSSQVRGAWQAWGALMHSGAAVYSGAAHTSGAVYALETPYDDVAFEKAMTRGKCELERGALTATGLNPAADNRLTFTLFPPISGTASPLLVSGDFMGQFSKNPNATALLKYLAGTKAQSMWVEQAGIPRGIKPGKLTRAYAFSADNNKKVWAAYPAGVQQQVADLLRPGSGKELCFSAEDMMEPDMSTAFEQAALDYFYDPGSLTNLLQGLQQTQQAHNQSPVAQLACARL
jgi:alpha-glucoside transport system substrate-binding protein